MALINTLSPCLVCAEFLRNLSFAIVCKVWGLRLSLKSWQKMFKSVVHLGVSTQRTLVVHGGWDLGDLCEGRVSRNKGIKQI